MTEKMPQDLMRYDLMAQKALRGVVRLALERIAQSGFPGDHHFYISFDTQAPGVRMSERLRQEYTEEMTIVLQHQYWGLEINDDTFQVELSFNDRPEKIVIPYVCIKGFFDPSVQFGLQFQNDADDELHEIPVDTVATTENSAVANNDEADAENVAVAAVSGGADVVVLDAFRKK